MRQCHPTHRDLSRFPMAPPGLLLVPALLLLPAVAAGESPPLRVAGFTVAETPVPEGRAASEADAEPESSPEGEAEQASSSGSGQQPKSALDRVVDEFVATGEAIEGREGDEPVELEETQGGQPALYSVLQVTKGDNPLMTRQCKREATDFSVGKLKESLGLERRSQAVQAAAEHIKGHLEDIANADGPLSYSKYLRAIANCEEFCAPLVASLVRCHTLSVARLDHGVVLFDFDSHTLPSRYRDDSKLLGQVAEALRSDAHRKVLLVGRASKIGDLQYNRRLSGQRALAVQDALMERGIPRDRIETTWFGWEPPQLTEAMAREYGLGELYERKGPQKLNQSVMVILYTPGEDPGGGGPARQARSGSEEGAT